MANRSAVTRHYLVESDFADLAKARAMKNLALTLYGQGDLAGARKLKEAGAGG